MLTRKFQEHPTSAAFHKFLSKWSKRAFNLDLVLLALLLPAGYGADNKLAREEGRFNIFVAGKEIGQEQFSIQASGDSIISSSIVNFGDPGSQNRNVRIETQLQMDDKYVPRTYHLRTDVGGQKGTIAGTFAPSQATFEYGANGGSRKTGLLVGDRYVVLDANVFHHFIFVGRLFDFAAAAKTQSLEVLIPQEMDYGILRINDAGVEKTSIRGEKRKLHHLRADSGSLQIDLWIDDQKVLYKIELPAKQIEVVRNH
jgi:hypothetical protein